jgi:hypothetical protein
MGSALAATARAAGNDILRAPEERWPDKFARIVTAVRNATIPLSHHDRELGDAATRGRVRRDPESDAVAPQEEEA